ncbi:MAG: beta-galactosidase trimerization domain-containing protein [Lentisphaeria bacterium]|nr:hypothetical protein [Lentisphaerota bacterium]MBR7145756.1 beta-galactosidase trimerization domain-containing protein [Lentisphaeria bacterium]
MKKHLRIAALQCNFQTEEQTLKMPEFWQDFGFNAEQLLHTHADMYSAIYDETRHGKLLEQYMANSQENNISTIVYMNCHILGPSIAGRKDEWGVRDADGNYPLSYNTYPACCLNSGWKDYFFDCIASLKKFNIYGLFFDGPHYHTCYCPKCQAKFQAATGKTYAEATSNELAKFTYESVIEFKNALYEHVKSVNPAWQMYFNEGLFVGRASSKDFARQLASDDIVGTEGGFFFYIEPKNQPFWNCGRAAKLAEAVAGDKPTVIFFAGDHKPWGWFMHTPAETALCYISAIGNGASVWYGIHCDPDNLASDAGRMAKRLVQFDKKYDELYQNTSSLADVAMFYSYDTAARYRKTAEETDLYGSAGSAGNFPGNYTEAVQGTFGVLSHLNRAYDAVCELNLHDLKRYKTVLAPNLAMVSQETGNALLEFVKNGGTLIADGEFGMYDENGSKYDRGFFADAAGFEFTGNYLDHKRFNYCAFPGFYAADNAHQWLPAPAWSAEITVKDDADIFGRANLPMAGCYEAKPQDPALPYAVKKSYGKGSIIYIAGAAFEFYYNFTHKPWRDLFGKLIAESSANEYVLENVSNAVTMSVRQSKDCVLIHLANYTSAVRPIEKSAVLHNVKLSVPANFTSATDLWSGRELKKIADGRFELETLEEVAVIKLV